MSNFIDDLTQTFIGATILTLRVQCKLEVVHKRTFLKGEQQQKPFSIGGLLGITSAEMKGSVVLGFPKSVFIIILQSLLNEPVNEISQDNEDAAAEMLNIIFSQAKTVTNKKGHAIQTAIPSVIHGDEIASSYSKDQRVHVLAFQIDDGEEFYIELLCNPLEQKEKEDAKLQSQMKHPSSVPASTKAAFVMQFINGVIETLKLQCSLDVVPGKPAEGTPNHTYPFDLASIVGITSNTVNGSFLLVFKQEVFIKLASKMFNEPVTVFQPETDDLVAELANMILGVAKRTLNAQGHGIHMAIPTVIRGSGIHSNHPKGRRVIVVPFQSEIGEFHVEIDIQA